jgi:crotonobetainyl-CoA:carnitine CoA-transferase CaiB-like acyl-CoA transferase
MGSFIEAAGWLCLGSDLGYFLREEAAEALRPFLSPEVERPISDEERRCIVGSDWAEHLASGSLDQALEIRLFADVQTEARTLQPAFQSAWNLAARLATSEPSNRLLRALLLSDDDDWRREGTDNGAASGAILRESQQFWKRLAAGHPFDGLVKTLHHLQILSTWVASTRVSESRWERPSALETSPQAMAIAERLLVKSVGKLLRWRLDLGNDRVRKRLEGAIDEADELLPELMRSIGYNIEDAWPEGFRAAMLQALAGWGEISGESTEESLELMARGANAAKKEPRSPDRGEPPLPDRDWHGTRADALGFYIAGVAGGAGVDFETYCQQLFDHRTAAGKPEALKGYRVLSCTQYILGPSCASYLAELGAEVIKIEVPRRGEPMRHTTPFNEPFLYPLSRWVPEAGTGLGFFGANPNEEFISLDFHRPEARQAMLQLAAQSDVMVQNYRPGTFDRWGLGYQHLSKVNPRLVYQWLGGFGGWGPGRVRAPYDILGQAMGGAFGITGEAVDRGGTPVKHTSWLADYWGGMMAAVAILAALYWRDTVSGEGTFIEYSQVHGVTRQLESALPLYGRYGIRRERWGNWDTELTVHGIIQCGKSSYPDSKNPQEAEVGYILVSAHTDEAFKKLCDVIGRKDLAGTYAKHDDRVKPENQDTLYGALEAWAKDKNKEDVATLLDKAGLNNQPVWNAKEVSEHPHWKLRGAVQWIDDPSFGDLHHQGPAYKMSETPPRIKWAFKPVGADNERVYGRLLGWTKAKLAKMEEAEVI